MAVHSTEELLNLAGGVLTATCMVWLGIVGFASSGKRRPVHGLSLALFLVSAWYALWMGIVFGDLLHGCRRLSAMPMFLGGLMGPLCYLFIRSLFSPLEPLPRRRLWLLGAGSFGALLALYLLLDERRAQEVWDAYRRGELLRGDRMALGLFLVHSAELVLFMALGAAVALRRLRCSEGGEQHRLAVLLLLTLLAALAGVVVTNVLPAFVPVLRLGGLASLGLLPAVGLAYVTLRANRALVLDLEAQRTYMSRYLPEHLVRQIVAGARLRLGGDETTATVLFSDVRAFTPLSEALAPEQVVRFLNRYLELMTEVVFRHEGMVDKFIGDAVLAVFGVPQADGRDAERALRCARAMLEAMDGFNAWWTGEGHAPVAIGIGLHRGKVVHGNIGSTNRVEYTVIGDTVNAASRVAGLNKELGVPLLLTGEVADALVDAQSGLRHLETRVLRGRSAETRLYAPVDLTAAVESGARGTAV